MPQPLCEDLMYGDPYTISLDPVVVTVQKSKKGKEEQKS